MPASPVTHELRSAAVGGGRWRYWCRGALLLAVWCGLLQAANTCQAGIIVSAGEWSPVKAALLTESTAGSSAGEVRGTTEPSHSATTEELICRAVLRFDMQAADPTSGCSAPRVPSAGGGSLGALAVAAHGIELQVPPHLPGRISPEQALLWPAPTPIELLDPPRLCG